MSDQRGRHYQPYTHGTQPQEYESETTTAEPLSGFLGYDGIGREVYAAGLDVDGSVRLSYHAPNTRGPHGFVGFDRDYRLLFATGQYDSSGRAIYTYQVPSIPYVPGRDFLRQATDQGGVLSREAARALWPRIRRTRGTAETRAQELEDWRQRRDRTRRERNDPEIAARDRSQRERAALDRSSFVRETGISATTDGVRPRRHRSREETLARRAKQPGNPPGFQDSQNVWDSGYRRGPRDDIRRPSSPYSGNRPHSRARLESEAQGTEQRLDAGIQRYDEPFFNKPERRSRNPENFYAENDPGPLPPPLVPGSELPAASPTDWAVDYDEVAYWRQPQGRRH